jgi:hypothetical protein
LDFSEGLAAVCSDSSTEARGLTIWKTCAWGFVDPSGRFVIEPRFDGASGFSEGLAPVQVSGKWGYADKTGKIVIAPQFEEAGGFSEGLALAEGGGFSGAWLLHEGQAFAKRGYIDRQGRWVFDQRVRRYLYESPFSEGVTPIQDSGDRSGYVDKAGRIVVKPQFTFAGEFSEGLAAVGTKSGCGCIDHSGRIVFELASGCFKLTYGRWGRFSEGMAVLEVPSTVGGSTPPVSLGAKRR